MYEGGDTQGLGVRGGETEAEIDGETTIEVQYSMF